LKEKEKIIKIQLEEEEKIDELMKIQLEEREEHCEKLEAEITSLRK
jgi:hypothetical protein